MLWVKFAMSLFGADVETFLLAMTTYIAEYKMLAAVEIVTTSVILFLLVRRYSENIRVVMHVYFAFLTLSSFLLLTLYMYNSLRNVDGLLNRAQELLGLRQLPSGMWTSGAEPAPAWLQLVFFALGLVLAVLATVFWFIDIKKKQTIWDYSKMPRWQKYLTLFLVIYGLTYFHALLFGIYFAMVAGVSPSLYLMYGLYNCPVNLVFIALLAPLVPRVNKPLYITICLMAIMAAFFNWIIGLSVNLDAIAVSPAGIYALLMLWRSTRKKS
jgi:hypothetical protein